ncbi:MAG: class E sortase [Brooklawnia sp.]|uniref:class E sortase n=1 Tax=Brooklawnia sp. TaxID=2699740 RepID=UPI003C79502D
MASSTRVRRSWSARGLRLAWLLLVVALVAAAIWVLWLLVGSNQLAHNQASRALAGFESSCHTVGGPAAEGSVIGMLGFPDSSADNWPILAGISGRELGTGVGWYPQTAEPGAVGNMVLTGYRVTNGEPFAGLLELEVGDRVQVTTCDTVHTYVIEVAPRELTVQADDSWVLDAVPGQPGRVPTGRMLTLVTSQDLLPTSDRSVGFATLASSQPR